ncbi:unnamed protein product [Miscanthus lutarioriparius]|uniref:Uncharacterized protein n=1 Tax=Miscanthus lutarioriparius TaxID=422564 RepID=A0A811Q0C5_9POAL|nr:unnamed protein product [Miscanthus lutarioriparius]
MEVEVSGGPGLWRPMLIVSETARWKVAVPIRAGSEIAITVGSLECHLLHGSGTLRHQLHRQKLGQEQLQQQPHRHHGHRQHQEQSNQQQPQQQHPVSLLRRSSSVVISMKGDTGGSSCGGGCCSRSFSSGWYSALLTTSFFLGDVSASLHAGDCLICMVVANKTRSRTGITVQCSTLGWQLGVHCLRHGLIVVEVEVRPAAGVQVVGALDAEERLVGRHAPLGLRATRWTPCSTWPATPTSRAGTCTEVWTAQSPHKYNT